MLSVSERRISESCCAATTFKRFERRPDADRPYYCTTDLFGFAPVEGCEVVAALVVRRFPVSTAGGLGHTHDKLRIIVDIFVRGES